MTDPTPANRVVTSTMQGELVNMAESSGVILQPTSTSLEAVDGSDTLFKLRLNAGCQGNYASSTCNTMGNGYAGALGYLTRFTAMGLK